MTHFLAIGTVLGLSAGFAPGPLLTLVIAETLQHGIKAGVKTALAPLVTDLPIILLTLLVISTLANFHTILGIISLAGGIFLLLTGIQDLRTTAVAIDMQEQTSTSFRKGVLANTLSPHPYLFWLSVGAPTVTKAMGQNTHAALAFILSFYLFLVGSKIVLAILVGKSRSLLSSNAYLFTLRFLGSVICVLAVALFRDGLELLGIL